MLAQTQLCGALLRHPAGPRGYKRLRCAVGRANRAVPHLHPHPPAVRAPLRAPQRFSTDVHHRSNSMVRAFLIYRGKYLTVRRFSGVPEMCAVETQQSTNEFAVDISERQNMLALCFRYENQQYLPKVDGGNLKLEKVGDAVDGNINANIPDNSWFVKEYCGLSGYYILRTVAEPPQYISTAPGNTSNRQNKLKLSEHRKDCIVVKQQRP